jgi:hypothetical protein
MAGMLSVKLKKQLKSKVKETKQTLPPEENDFQQLDDFLLNNDYDMDSVVQK